MKTATPYAPLEIKPETHSAPGLQDALRPMYVVGGRQRAPRSLSAGNQDWNGYDQAVIIELDPRTGALQPRVQYVSPPDMVAPDDPAITFQAGYIQGNELYLCTQTEVLIYHLPDFERTWYLSLPLFNDLHHARPSPRGHVLVANAGLEMVLEISRRGEILNLWNVLGQDPWEKFSRDVDYRPLSTKPHSAHPNYLFCIGDEIWSTRFHQGDALCLNDPHKRIPLSTERIHDGVVYEGLVYFTTVNGRILIANPRTLTVEEVIDLTTMHKEDELLGWCRALRLHDGYMWVGFSRIRPTKFRENVSWVMRGFKRTLPTHIGLYDLKARRCVMEIDLEPMGVGAVYSLFEVAPSVNDQSMQTKTNPGSR